MSDKPILIRTGGLTNRIYAVRRYRQRGDLVISSQKDDVTDEAIHAVAEHRQHCEDKQCACQS